MDKLTGKKSKTNKSNKTDYTANREEFAEDTDFCKDKNNKSNKTNCK